MNDDPPPLEYAGRTPNASRHVDDETKSLGEGCAAIGILFVALPVAMLVIAMIAIGCLTSVVVVSR